MRTLPIVVLVGAVAFVACQRAQAPAPAASQEAAPPVAEEAVLAAADAADGTVDHVVSKCATCRLGMDGVAEHSSTYKGYEMHFCSTECKDAFDHDPGSVIRNLPPAHT